MASLDAMRVGLEMVETGLARCALETVSLGAMRAGGRWDSLGAGLRRFAAALTWLSAEHEV